MTTLIEAIKAARVQTMHNTGSTKGLMAQREVFENGETCWSVDFSNDPSVFMTIVDDRGDYTALTNAEIEAFILEKWNPEWDD